MSVWLILPYGLAGGKDVYELTGATIADCLDELEVQFPNSRSQIRDEDGQIHIGIGIFVRERGSQAYSVGDLNTRLEDGDEIFILSWAGGG